MVVITMERIACLLQPASSLYSDIQPCEHFQAERERERLGISREVLSLSMSILQGFQWSFHQIY